ncbi:hypothetical protein GPECTOR_2g939 [Gonium pectorale]|uniref:Chromo domain-containing protein n=1 Tax=Gonium pectorale TaxID=33097 RepID=A0A150H1M9_GONPE|nr:hypothetical protein GPECTOR_2g939 [Gonium pectorale]|eukprot:KXZ56057.1 hypothetical protein GPECTOR_2g939 [Gonium pectorale]
MSSQALGSEEIDEILAHQQQDAQHLHQHHEAHYEDPPFEETEPDYYDGEGRSGGRAFGRGFKGVNEAAEALLGMGVAGEGDAYEGELGIMGLVDPGEQVVLQRPDFPYPRDTLRPGRVVWAKVEGHDWWPAKVVRRRAVPREVGPPPGGHASVHLYIPVVFFTNKGIPGEVEERLDTAQGIVAASMRALGMAAGEEEEDEEAEYAWLPLDCIKPFHVGDVSGSGEDAGPVVDQNLRTSIAHARGGHAPGGGAVWEGWRRRRGSAQGGGGAGGGEDDAMTAAEEDFESDSDGGWGPSAHYQAAAAAARSFRGSGRGRGGRGRGRGRGRGGRGRGRGRRGMASRTSDDEDELLDELPLESAYVNPADAFSLGAGGLPVQKNVVEAICGWRFPLSEQEKQQERDRQRQLGQERHRILDRLRKSSAEGSPNAEAIADAVAAASVAAAAAAAASKAAAAASAAAGGGGGQSDRAAIDEADAAAALLGFGEDADASAAAAGVSGAAADGTAADGAAAAAATDREPEYLVKWAHKSHIHNEWLKESALAGMARRKLLSFKKHYGDRPCIRVEESWTRPERFVSRRPSPVGPGWEVLIKWTGLGYEHATWEAEGNKHLLQPEYVALHTAMWARCKRALHKASRAAADAAAEARAAAAAPSAAPGPVLSGPESVALADLPCQPPFVTGGLLQPHQLAALNWLRRMWAAGQHAILSDDMGLGKTATVTAYLQCLIHEFKVTGPLLVVAPQSVLDFWEGEWSYWAAGSAAQGAAPGPTANGGPAANHSSAGGPVASSPSGPSAGAVPAPSPGPGVNVVVYRGSAAVRGLLHEQELWLSPPSMDRKGAFGRGRDDCPSKVPKADVVIAGYEHVLSDLNVLKAVPWEAVVVDLRQRSRSVTGRSTGALAELGGRHRLLVMAADPTVAPLEDVAGFVQFIRPDVQAYDPDEFANSEAAAEVARTRMAEALEPRRCRRLGPEVERHVAARREVQVPCELSDAQAEAYRTALARNYEALADPRVVRPGSHRAAVLRQLCNELRKAGAGLADGAGPECTWKDGDSQAGPSSPAT